MLAKDAGLLSQVELDKLNSVVWSHLDGDSPSLPAGLELYPHLFVETPRPNGDAKSDVTDRLFRVDKIEFDADRLYSMGAAARGSKPIYPNSAQAAALFDRLVGWRPKRSGEVDLQNVMLRAREEQLAHSIGYALSWSIVPSIEHSERTQGRARAILQLIDAGRVKSAIPSLPHFHATTDLPDSTRSAIAEQIFRGLQSDSHEEVKASAEAVEIWSKFVCPNQGARVPKELTEKIVAATEMGHKTGLQSVLWCATQLVKNGTLSADSQKRLAKSLGDLWATNSYDSVDPYNRAAVSVSIIRSQCVLLAHALAAVGVDHPAVTNWLNVTKDDPLPEVRFVLAE